jgi:hypothetical protein
MADFLQKLREEAAKEKAKNAAAEAPKQTPNHDQANPAKTNYDRPFQPVDTRTGVKDGNYDPKPIPVLERVIIEKSEVPWGLYVAVGVTFFAVLLLVLTH